MDVVVFSTGIRPQDTLGRYGELAIADRGGVLIDDHCLTSDPDIYAIGECATLAGPLLRAGGTGLQDGPDHRRPSARRRQPL